MTQEQSQPLQATKPETTPQDFFLHVLSMVALYICAASFLTIVFQAVNIFFYDPLDYGSTSNFYDKMRFSLASIIVIFPVYVVTMVHLNRLYHTRPGTRTMRIRRWLVAFTLFVAAFIIIGDTIALVQNLLSGETKVRFLIKVAAVLFVAISITVFYVWDGCRFNGKGGFAIGRFRVFIGFVSAVILFVTIGGLFMVGSPTEKRARRFDERRAQDLQTIQSQIINYWQYKEKLPDKLLDLEDATRGVYVPRDPETQKEYEYNRQEKESFELCAVFNLSSFDKKLGGLKSMPGPEQGGLPESYYTSPFGASGDNWTHEAGRDCFDRKIDRAFFKPTKEMPFPERPVPIR